MHDITIELIDHATIYERLSLVIRFDNHEYPDINIILLDKDFPIHLDLRSSTRDLFDKIEYVGNTILGDGAQIGIHTTSLIDHPVRVLFTNIDAISRYNPYNKIYIGCRADGTTTYFLRIF
jgi:hypothetical protein